MTEPKTGWKHGSPPRAPFVDTERAGEDWRVRKACRDMDPEAFFEDGRSPAALAVIEGARAVCSGCPVRGRCGDYALDRGIEFGIWGGLTPAERAVVLDGRSRRAGGALGAAGDAGGMRGPGAPPEPVAAPQIAALPPSGPRWPPRFPDGTL
jgi:WhiB family redox-sensing transcriptional regulator